MPPPTEQIKCPRDPAHGLANKRWLAPEERQMITRGDGDVFEIDCHFCGKYENRLDISELDVGGDFRDDDQSDFW